MSNYNVLTQPGLSPYAIRTGKNALPPDLEKQVAGYVAKERQKFSDARQLAEVTWQEAWALYIGSPEAMDELRANIVRTVGDANVDWRHKINVGKAFEAVETIHGYLMAATFPNRDWFSVEPRLPADLKLATLVQKYMQKKFEEGNFRAHYENFLRQLIITGNSVMALPWRYETQKYKKKVKVPKVKRPEVIDLDGKPYEWQVIEEERIIQNRPDFETLDMFDVWFDTNVPDPNQGAFIRRLHKTKAEIIEDINSGLYRDVPLEQIHASPKKPQIGQNRNDIYMGIDNSLDWSYSDIVEVWEYWGDVHLEGVTYKDVIVTTMGNDILLRWEQNPFWGGRPFIYGSYIPVMQTYAMGAVQPNMGLLHELNIVTNQRLDNLELSIDQMWTLRADGLLQPNEVYTEPGRVFLVADHNDLQPVPGTNADYPITYQESGVLESFIDKNFGTPPLIGTGQPRGGERVTAQEIQAVRDAGGNRLSNVHKHIEETALMPLLSKVMRLMQQFVEDDELVRVANGDGYDYYQVGADELNGEWKLKPIGADYVADRQKYIQQRLDFLAAVTQIPQMAPKINYDNILRDLVTHFGFDDPDSYVVSSPGMGTPEAALPPGATDPAAQGQMMPPGGMPMIPDAGSDIASQLYDLGGAPLQQAVGTDFQAGGINKVLAEYMGADVSGLQ